MHVAMSTNIPRAESIDYSDCKKCREKNKKRTNVWAKKKEEE